MIRFLIDRLVGLVLVVGVTLLSPALLVFGRSVRAKLIGLRAIMTLSAAATFTIWASDYSLNGGSPLGSDLLRYGFLPTFGLLWLLSLFLQVTGTRRHWDNVLGWSSLHHDRHLFVKAEARADVEADFLRVAVTVLTRLHPLLPRGRGAAMRAVMGDWLDELDEDGQLSRLPSMVTFPPSIT